MGEDEIEPERVAGPWLCYDRGYSRWDGDTGGDDEGHSNSDADCLVLSLLVERYLTLTDSEAGTGADSTGQRHSRGGLPVRRAGLSTHANSILPIMNQSRFG